MAARGGWNAVFWCNHDQPRIVSRFGAEGAYWKQSAKMLGTFVHLLRGTPYIYQGEELGMTNAGFTRIEQYNDVESRNYYQILLERGATPEEALQVLAERSRDNARTPMQWNGGKNAGFTEGDPWLAIPENYHAINAAEEEADPDSVLHYYRKLVRLRKEFPVIAEGSIRFLETGNEKVFAYERALDGQKLVVVCSFSREAESVTPDQDWRAGRVLIANGPENQVERLASHTMILEPFEAFALLR